jgi:hypothetical protein
MESEALMSDFQWCHGPSCHTNKTQDRIRGVKGSKVLRTRKVLQNKWNENSFYRYFCSNGCYNDFANKHISQVIAIAPRLEALETPVNINKETVDSPYWGRRVETKIEVDETRQT